MAGVFVLGYAGIIFEENLTFNKSGVGLLMAVTLWTIRSIGVWLQLSPNNTQMYSVQDCSIYIHALELFFQVNKKRRN